MSTRMVVRPDNVPVKVKWTAPNDETAMRAIQALRAADVLRPAFEAMSEGRFTRHLTAEDLFESLGLEEG